MVLSDYTYVFAIGTMFALLEAFNNGANDVANSWATSVSSRSLNYRAAMVCAFVFELIGALTVGARTASTIKNGIISPEAFQGNAGVQLLAFACAAAGAGTWVMFCSMNNIHVSSTYSLISALVGVGIATVGTEGVTWGWNGGNGVGAIFAGLLMAPFIAGCFGAIIFMLIKLIVHMRKNPVPWAIWTSPFFFLIAGTVCTLTIVYKGSPRLGLSKKPAYWIAGVTLGAGFALCLLSVIFFLPFVHAKVIKKNQELKWWEVVKGPLLWRLPYSNDATARVPNFEVIQYPDDSDSDSTDAAKQDVNQPAEAGISSEKTTHAQPNTTDIPAPHSLQHEMDSSDYKKMMALARARHHANIRKKANPLGWAMRTLHENPMGAGSLYETHNILTALKRIPAMCIVALLYGTHYDIHTAQIGLEGTPEGKRMARTYAHATKYSNEVEYLYSFVQIITACTASFAHGANDVGNAVGVWAGMYAAWTTGRPAASKEDVPLWQIAVITLTLCIGFMTYGYNIMKVMGNKITYHSPSRGSSMEMGAAITVLIFSQYKLPVSTSMCITGATVGVGLCNGSLRAVNWQRVFLLLLSWFITIPAAGLLAGCTMGLALNTPHFN
ncbi:hypothetical protein RBB50_007408 [Rhinocladiella similis]